MERKAIAIRLATLVAAAALVDARPAAAQSHQHGVTAETKPAGDLHSTCRPAVTGLLAQGVQLLHEFAFDDAVAPFRTAAHSDVDCVMAHWGAAMAQWGRYVGSGSSEALGAGWQSLDFAALATRAASDRERRYLAALELRYRHRVGSGPTLYAAAMRELAGVFPDDAQAQLFSALAQVQLAQAGGPDAVARRQGALTALDGLGGSANAIARAHYSVLAGDHPELATRVGGAATALAASAVTSPYLLHLPSHVFMRRGLWSEAISANERSADAARRAGRAADELHALDALSYAYLQVGRSGDAASIAARIAGGYLGELATPDAERSRAAIVARGPVEGSDCRTAQQLADLPDVGAGRELLWLARAVGAARCGDAAAAAAAAGALDGGRITGLAANAWAQFARGRVDEAVEAAGRAADLEDAATVAAWTPPVLPAREQLAELLLLAGRPEEAMAAYHEVLKVHAGRARAAAGLARADAAARRQR